MSYAKISGGWRVKKALWWLFGQKKCREKVNLEFRSFFVLLMLWAEVLVLLGNTKKITFLSFP
jgi:hypothetical protein